MSKDDFINTFNDSPENVLGFDWERYLDGFLTIKFDERQLI